MPLSDYYDKICYCPIFHSWIRPSFIMTESNWKFRTCNEKGEYRSGDHTAKTRINNPAFKWESIK